MDTVIAAGVVEVVVVMLSATTLVKGAFITFMPSSTRPVAGSLYLRMRMGSTALEAIPAALNFEGGRTVAAV